MSISFVLVLGSRLPFLDAGYGTPGDGWRVGRVARELATTGQYSVSRFPGYPVQEIVCSWIWRGGPFALNGASAALSAVAAVAFAAIARHLGLRYWWLGALAFAATPIVFFSSVCAKDYIWAVALILLSLWSALQKKSIIAGLFLGLAAGCRLTSLGLLPAIAILLVGQTRGRETCHAIMQLVGAALGAAVIVFSPVWLRYGTGFFTFYESFGRPSPWKIFSRATVEVWGSFGLIALALVLGLMPFRRVSSLSPNKWILGSLDAGIIFELALYLRLPHEAAYLLPVVPLALLLVFGSAPPSVVRCFCFVLLFSSFIDISPAGLAPGVVLRDHAERLQTLTRIRDFLTYAQTLPGRNVIVVGGWQPQIAVLAPTLAEGRTHYAYLMNESDIIAAYQRGERVFYLPMMRDFNYNFNGVDLAAYGGIDLHEQFVGRANQVQMGHTDVIQSAP